MPRTVTVGETVGAIAAAVTLVTVTVVSVVTVYASKYAVYKLAYILHLA